MFMNSPSFSTAMLPPLTIATIGPVIWISRSDGVVTFTGWVRNVGQHLQAADVYVFPSLEEGMSNALLEACAWRRVIVASDIAANRAVLGDEFPLLFRAGDTADLASSLRRAFLNAPLRLEAQRQVETRIQESSIDAVVNRLEELLHASGRLPMPWPTRERKIRLW